MSEHEFFRIVSNFTNYLGTNYMADILFKDESYKIIGACFEVHKALGHGFKEVVYKDALEIEFDRIGMAFQREKLYDIYYKEQKLKHCFAADFVV